MASPVAYNPGRSRAIQRSFELLCDYLNFGGDLDTTAGGLVRHVLRSPYIAPFFDEYTRDYLMEAEEVEDIDYQALQSFCRMKNAFQSKNYAHRSAVDKSGWCALDHATRFMVQALQYSWRKDGPWDHGQWEPESDDGDVEFWQVWMVLRHLQAEWEAANLEEWSEDGLNEMFRQFRLKL
ncbi:hypothetical protein JX265_012324 [Neoarthrinium moseri]|uniref:Uncharacterized protein n=1 Tax=Neoarthrinium moseri TaxID=1658444 RepID=A0A9P9WAU8_9PEZI|nr:uncharacterized protein JN550_011228 [Neoarthrinium moseri]KAI1851594.1 hypothetical protein JX266_003056 [Neoarthrinium moseri]KAI1854969.1 hypothetical protein JX265_012324 [Neoarthrinium moseri]KAI1860913.1 hypothetical protein JN550_011228 [Neoarthrinium moseri]